MPTTYPLRGVRCWTVYDPQTGQRTTEPDGTYWRETPDTAFQATARLRRDLPHSLALTLVYAEYDRLTGTHQPPLRTPLTRETLDDLLGLLSNDHADPFALPLALTLTPPAAPQRPYQDWAALSLSVELETL